MPQEKDISEIIYRSHYIRLNESQQEMILESATNILKDILQAALGSAAEYGLALTGVGLPVAPAVETLIDAIFVADSLKESVDEAAGSNNRFTAGKDIMRQVLNPSNLDLSGGFPQFYERIKRIWQSIGNAAPGELERVEQHIEAMKEELSEALAQLIRPLRKSVQFIIPDSVTGTVASQVISRVTQATQNPYTAITQGISSVQILSDFVQNPERAKQIFENLIDQLVQMLNTVAERVGEGSSALMRAAKFSVATAVAGPLGGALAASNAGGRLTGEGVRSAANFIEQRKPMIAELVQRICGFLIPSVLALLASQQILMNSEWRAPEQAPEQQDPEALPAEAPSTAPEEEVPAQALNEGVWTSKRFKVLAGIR
jgi:hypothetical protein